MPGTIDLSFFTWGRLGSIKDCSMTWRLSSLRVGPKPEQSCFLQISSHLRDCLMVLDVHFDITHLPSLAFCYVLGPGTGCCPDLVNHIISYTIYHLLLCYIILWCLPNGTVIHFILPLPKTKNYHMPCM